MAQAKSEAKPVRLPDGSTVTAVKVRVNMAMRMDDPGFKGAWAAGIWWPAGDAKEALIEADEPPKDWLARQAKLRDAGDLAGGPVTDAQGKILQNYSLEQKLGQLFTLEGRKRDEFGNWSEAGFEITTEQGNPRNPKPNPRAPITAKIQIYDRRDTDGVWESERASAPPTPAAPSASAKQQQR